MCYKLRTAADNNSNNFDTFSRRDCLQQWESNRKR